MVPRYRTHAVAFGILLALSAIFGISCRMLQVGSSGTISPAPPLIGTPGISPEKPLQGSTAALQGEAWFEGRCGGAQFPSASNLEIQPVPSMDEPAPRQPFIDPVFGTCVVRVTDHAADLAGGDPSRGMKNEYSRVQSFNADGSLLIAFTTGGNWYLYDGFSLQPLGALPIWHEPRWDSGDPGLLYYTEDTRLMSYRISNGQQQVVHEFAGDFPGQDLAAVWTKYEGSPSVDNRYWGLMAEDTDWMTVAILVYDLQADQIVAMRETPPSEIDSVAISPLSNYFLVYHDNYCEPGRLGSAEAPCGLMVYDKNLENARGLLRIVGHSDLVLDVHEQEVLVYQDIDTDTISMLDLSSGEILPLLPIDFSRSNLGFHFSGRSFRMPGWILISTYNGSQPSSTWMDDQVFAVELVEGGQVVRLAHTHSVVDDEIGHDYWAEPHASVSPDFTQVVFTSNWGRSGTGEVDMYMINLPENWVSQIP